MDIRLSNNRICLLSALSSPMFRIEPLTGVIRLQTDLNYELETEHTILVEAEDGGGLKVN